MTAPLVEFERTENERLAPEIERNRIDREILAATIKHAQAQAAKAGDPETRTKMREQAHESGEQLAGMKVLYALQLIADDATPEALSKAINEQGGRIALLSPEGEVFDLMAGRPSL